MFVDLLVVRKAVLATLVTIFFLPHAWSEVLDIPLPIIQPGYAPAVDAKDDEKGFWMSMDEAVKSLERSPLVVRDGVLDEYVNNLACEIAEEYCSDLKVFVIRNPYFNASMAPNGAMLVHTGLLVRAVSSDQVAAVLGHELAHYTQTHSIKRWRVLKNRMTVGALFSIALGDIGEIFVQALSDRDAKLTFPNALFGDLIDAELICPQDVLIVDLDEVADALILSDIPVPGIDLEDDEVVGVSRLLCDLDGLVGRRFWEPFGFVGVHVVDINDDASAIRVGPNCPGSAFVGHLHGEVVLPPGLADERGVRVDDAGVGVDEELLLVVP